MTFPLDLNNALTPLLMGLALVLIAFSIFIYRYTNPPISRQLKAGLAFLRALAFVILLFMLMEPILSFTEERVKEPVIAVLMDNSASMTLRDATPDSLSRLEWAQQFAQTLSSLNDKGEVRYFSFSSQVREVPSPEVLQGDGGATNMGHSLREVADQLKDQNLAAAVFLTDGANNSGTDPVRAAQTVGIPVFTVGIGDSSIPKDVAITRFLTNEVAYVNNRIPIEVTIQSSGFASGETTLILREDNQTLDTAPVSLTSDLQHQNATLHFTPTTEGVHKYTLTIPVQNGEKIRENNTRIFLVNVLKNKIQVLLTSGSPSYDFSFMSKSLKADPNIDVTTMAMVKPGEFYQQLPDGTHRKSVSFPATEKALNTYDLIILMDMNLRYIQTGTQQLLVDLVENKGKAVWFVGGKQTFDRGGFRRSPLVDLMPVQLGRGTINQQFQIKRTPDGEQSAILQVDDDPLVSDDMWNEFPPLLGANLLGAVNPGATVLAEHPLKKTPIIATGRAGRGKTMVFGAYSFWRWRFFMEGVGYSSDYFDRFVGNAVRWLVTREVDQRVKINTDQNVYRSGETITFTAQIYDENYQPVNEAKVEVTVTSKTGTDFVPIHLTLLPTPEGNGIYTGTISALPADDYEFSGYAEYRNRRMGEDTGEFTVSIYSFEYENTRMNAGLLKRVASSQNGKFYTPDNAGQLQNDIHLEAEIISQHREVTLWNNGWFFVLFVGLLAVEWAARKRKGLA
ncbi:MAG: VWA domain-containing protein [Gemmatimonadetes bacterium]|nr:MAG: VWA domain-containing protein [Gemmatimonadota bacterium]